MTPALAVVGDPVQHSLSPVIHRAAIESAGLRGWRYQRVRVPAGELAARWGEIRRRYVGINVTAPLKLEAGGLVDRLTGDAQRARSVNTVSFAADRSVGASTDGRGFLAALERAEPRPVSRALVLGAGGAARAVAVALLDRGAEVVVAARDLDRARAAAGEVGGGCRAISMIRSDLAPALESSDLLVNATPLGGPGHLGRSPLPQGMGPRPDTIVYDLLYIPATTSLMAEAKRAGCTTVGGLGMLVEQAALAFELFTGRAAERPAMFEAAARAVAKVQS